MIALRLGRSGVAVSLAALFLVMLGGCRSGVSVFMSGEHQPIPVGGADFGVYDQSPKPRLGGLPYPGAFTLFEAADPRHLGHHAYDQQSGETEKDRGIIYTCRGGFIDVAHTRKTIDLCKYAQVRAEMALLNDWSAFRLKGLEPSIYVIHLQYPPFWKSLPGEEKKRVAHELSIRMAQRIAMTMVSWHELLTWFGYSSAPFISERQSAFTYDDTASHALGVTLGGRALRDNAHDWDSAVTIALNDAMRELGAVTPNQTEFAARKVEGLWWSGFDPLKRDIETGLDGQPIVPWTVRDLPFCGGAAPYRYEVPRVDDVMGRNFRGMFRLEIEPNVMQAGAICEVLPEKPARIDVDRDLPRILEYIKMWHMKHEGDQSLRPY